MAAYLAFKSVVDPSDCDFLGHMNVSKYFAASSDAVFALQAEMGLTADDMRSGRNYRSLLCMQQATSNQNSAPAKQSKWRLKFLRLALNQ
ncbi:thioesterase family protein [Ruegeria arenilitoris]|uniref:thioesterase family protein n=1 Tax=Ruegeria arenilitoris TaxID=1173585 RepID=UPI001479FD25|nr:thioesterase family protein [Ruegeria arenilitoris]